MKNRVGGFVGQGVLLLPSREVGELQELATNAQTRASDSREVLLFRRAFGAADEHRCIMDAAGSVDANLSYVGL
jgi:hypothetical protein